ncbi:MAG TPA: hypothetical protein VEL68_04200, partial [Thermodesulfobacteriota bacterium]|nr:hypothetical protein [Thermodesulfobacteriota bacterium]
MYQPTVSAGFLKSRPNEHESSGKAHSQIRNGFFVLVIDDLVKSLEICFSVVPAKAGIQVLQINIRSLDSGFHRSDDFLRVYQSLEYPLSEFVPDFDIRISDLSLSWDDIRSRKNRPYFRKVISPTPTTPSISRGFAGRR